MTSPDKAGVTFLGDIAAIAEKLSTPFDRLPGGQRVAEPLKQAAATVRSFDGAVQEVSPLVKRVRDRIRTEAEALGIDVAAVGKAVKREGGVIPR